MDKKQTGRAVLAAAALAAWTAAAAAAGAGGAGGAGRPAAAGAAAILPASPELLEADWLAQAEEFSRIDPRGYRFPPGQALNRQAMKWPSDTGPAAAAARRLGALAAKLKSLPAPPDLKRAEKLLERLRGRKSFTRGDYLELRRCARETALSNPLLDFDDILFVSHSPIVDFMRQNREYDGQHFCDQYYGHNAKRGGGLFILKGWKSGRARVVDVTAGLRVPCGRNRGMPLSEGAFLSPDLSWDGKRIVFAWSAGGTGKWDPANRYNLFSVNVDGTGLARLTDNAFDEFDPVWLPNGRIVFISSMRGGYGRCHERPVPVFTMFSMKADGGDRYPIDFHETNEFQPSVGNDGMLVYTRWDYVDRDHSAAHHMWHCAPDGRDPRSYHGNYALPLSTDGPGPYPRGLGLRPWAEYNCRAVPGSGKYIATAGPHHGQSFGSLILIDIKTPDDNKMSQVRRITPDAPFPESETRPYLYYPFGTPWPLSESFYLCNYRDSLCVLDEFGNRDLICKTANGMRPIDPIPLRPRKAPPVVPCRTFQGERASESAPAASVCVMDARITDSFGKLPVGARIKRLRVVQILPKSTWNIDHPRIGYGEQSLARVPLGTAPVEPDGSVCFRAPVGRAIYFQLLDGDGMAVQSMRSATYVHPGERLTCLGCHEDKYGAAPAGKTPLALRRKPSELEPEIPGQAMFGFHSHVRPILERKCAACHRSVREGKTGPSDMSYPALRKYAFYFGHGYLKPLHGGSRTTPGKFGARRSRMGRALLDPVHRKALADGAFSREDRQAVFLWLDLNSNEFSAYRDTGRQRKGEIVWPVYDMDPRNYTGVEKRP